MNPYLFAVFVGGFVAGALAYSGTPAPRLLQVVASGVFGKAAFAGGLPMAAVGLALHFVMSMGR